MKNSSILAIMGIIVMCLSFFTGDKTNFQLVFYVIAAIFNAGAIVCKTIEDK